MRNAPNRIADFFDTYTRDLKAEDLQRLFTRDTREAYQFFTRGHDRDAFKHLPWHRRAWAHVKTFFVAFTMRLSPARRIVYAVALFFAASGLLNLVRGVRLGRAVVGGLLFATLATLLVLPSVFALVQARAHRRPASLDPDDPRTLH